MKLISLVLLVVVHLLWNLEVTNTVFDAVQHVMLKYSLVLSELTGDNRFQRAALRASAALLALRSNNGLLGNHVNVTDGSWPYRDSGIGHGVDSYYEYLSKVET
jgi:hypothetical protein